MASTTRSNANSDNKSNQVEQKLRSVFDLPSDLFDSCRLLHDGKDTSTSIADSSLVSSFAFGLLEESSAIAIGEYLKVDAPEDQPTNQKVVSRWSCNSCKVEFESLQDQHSHFNSDFHRFNCSGTSLLCITDETKSLMDIPIPFQEVEFGGDVENKPQIGMLFNSEKEAYDFYNSYGRSIGFSIRRDYANWSNKDKTVLTSQRFCCCKQGQRKKDKRDIYINRPRAETRTSCKARMGIYLKENGKYECRDFIEEHNHVLHLPKTTHMMRSQRNITDIHTYEIELGDDSGIRPKALFEYMARQVGGRENLGYTKIDHKNYLRTRRQHDLASGEVDSLFQYFGTQSRVNPSFTYSVQLDSLKQITNIFWADAKMIIDYAHFGDVVSFDTTFCTNREYRPFGVFVGFNHHRGSIIFGAALLYDETAESFKWLFETFAEAHGHKKPMTIFTDQDAAMAKALHEVWPETWHGLCTWHIMQNGIKHLGNLMKDGSCFLRDLTKCIYQYEEELEFEEAWQKLLSEYRVESNSWLHRIYGLKNKWAKCYMKNTLTLGIRSTQLSESLNSDLKDYLKSSLDLVQFFKHFDRVVNDKRANELQAEFNSRQKLPRHMFSMSLVMQQAGEVYTPTIFEEFQDQYNKVSVCFIKSRIEHNPLQEYVVGIVHSDSQFQVYCNPCELVVNCSCKKYETFGILCCHCLKVLNVLDIKCIPEAYILRRWTRAARSLVVEDNEGKKVEEDVNLDCIERCRRLCPKLVQIATQASNSVEGYALLNKVVNEVSKQLNSMNGSKSPQVVVSNEVANVTNAIVLKKKKTCNSGRRKKGWVEDMGKKGKSRMPSSTQNCQELQSDSAPPIELSMGKKRKSRVPSNTQNCKELQSAPAPLSELSMWNLPYRSQQMDSTYSYTSLLMGASDDSLAQALYSQASTTFMPSNDDCIL